MASPLRASGLEGHGRLNRNLSRVWAMLAIVFALAGEETVVEEPLRSEILAMLLSGLKKMGHSRLELLGGGLRGDRIERVPPHSASDSRVPGR